MLTFDNRLSVAILFAATQKLWDLCFLGFSRNLHKFLYNEMVFSVFSWSSKYFLESSIVKVHGQGKGSTNGTSLCFILCSRLPLRWTSGYGTSISLKESEFLQLCLTQSWNYTEVRTRLTADLTEITAYFNSW